MNKRNLITAIITGGSFMASFLLCIEPATDLFLKWFPSQQEDDVRFDLFLPVFGSAYAIGALASFLVGQITAKLIGRKFSTRTHFRFVLFVPLLYLIAYLAIVIVLLSFSAISFHNETLDNFLVYFVGFVVMIAGYYRLLNKSWRAKVY